ncbi:MAG: DUF3108 domain-containing protein [Gammaproteobacteria bacterium]
MPDISRPRISWLAGLVVLAGWLLVVPAVGAADAEGSAAPGLAVPFHEAIYHASVRGIPVRAGLRLEPEGEAAFLYRSWVEPRGLFSFIRKELSETSLVMLDDTGAILPLSYRKLDELGGRHSDMRFDHARGKVHIEFRGEQTTVDWEPGIYDLLSLRLALAHDLARDALQDVYQVVDDRSRVEAVDVIVVGRETLSTPLGELETVRLEYRGQRRDRLFKLWMAPGMDAALVRMEQYEEGRLRGQLNLVEYRRL